jgi:UDP-glucose 4-epimerase
MKKILITGCNGFIGRNLHKLLSNYDHSIECVSRKELDIIDSRSVLEFFSDKYYDVIIHTAIEGGRRTYPDTEKMFYNNILMIYNLLSNKRSFDRLITFGSGAELDRKFNINRETKPDERYPVDFYGMSKNLIAKLCLLEECLYNFRIFNCFGVDEDSNRMIRHNIENNINGMPMVLYSNRLMDFFYIKDLAILLHYFINNSTGFPKTIDCVYDTPTKLSEILDIINSISNNPVDIIYKNDDSPNKINSMDNDYIGNYTELPINYIGLKNGIFEMYNIIKEGAI